MGWICTSARLRRTMAAPFRLCSGKSIDIRLARMKEVQEVQAQAKNPSLDPVAHELEIENRLAVLLVLKEVR